MTIDIKGAALPATPLQTGDAALVERSNNLAKITLGSLASVDIPASSSSFAEGDTVLGVRDGSIVRLTGVEGSSPTPEDGSVTNAMLANVATATIKGRATASTGVPEDLTATQVRTILNVEDGATADMTAAEMAAVLEATPSLSYVAVDDLDVSGAGALMATALIAHLGASGGEFIAVNSAGDDLEILSGEPDETTFGTATQSTSSITLDFTGLPGLNTTTSQSITTVSITSGSIPIYGSAEWHVIFGGSHTITIPTGAYSSVASITGASGQRVPIIIKRVATSEFEYRIGAIMAVI
jgi:hypothetical protein